MLFRQPNRPDASAQIPRVDPGCRGPRAAPWSTVHGVGSVWPIRLFMRAYVGLSQPAGLPFVESRAGILMRWRCAGKLIPLWTVRILPTI
jgi:hypothetical protein